MFHEWKGVDYVPKKTDSSLKWPSTDPLYLPPMLIDITEKPSAKFHKNLTYNTNSTSIGFVPAIKFQVIARNYKHALDEDKEASPF